MQQTLTIRPALYSPPRRLPRGRGVRGVPRVRRRRRPFRRRSGWTEVRRTSSKVQGFMIACSYRFSDCFYWKFLPEDTTCLGWMAAVLLPTSSRTTENRNQALLEPIERVIIKPSITCFLWPLGGLITLEAYQSG